MTSEPPDLENYRMLPYNIPCVRQGPSLEKRGVLRSSKHPGLCVDPLFWKDVLQTFRSNFFRHQAILSTKRGTLKSPRRGFVYAEEYQSLFAPLRQPGDTGEEDVSQLFLPPEGLRVVLQERLGVEAIDDSFVTSVIDSVRPYTNLQVGLPVPHFEFLVRALDATIARRIVSTKLCTREPQQKFAAIDQFSHSVHSSVRASSASKQHTLANAGFQNRQISPHSSTTSRSGSVTSGRHTLKSLGTLRKMLQLPLDLNVELKRIRALGGGENSTSRSFTPRPTLDGHRGLMESKKKMALPGQIHARNGLTTTLPKARSNRSGKILFF